MLIQFEKTSKIIDREQEQEKNRMTTEMKLMEFEEMLSKAMLHAEKMQVQKNWIAMETEDMLSLEAEKIYRSQANERLRDKVKKDIEKRKQQEEDEKKARALATEERRKAVLERLKRNEEEVARRQKELEEQVAKNLSPYKFCQISTINTFKFPAGQKLAEYRILQFMMESELGLMAMEDELSRLQLQLGL